MKRIILILVSIMALLSCSKEAKVGERYRNSVKPPVDLYIYGGARCEVYLGKLNASKFDSESIWNKFGEYGSKYKSNSIWNRFGTFGSEYDSYSPFNKYSTTPPILYDRYGKSYGYFTANKNLAGRADYELIDIICDYYKDIREDVSGWYDKIFY